MTNPFDGARYRSVACASCHRVERFEVKSFQKATEQIKAAGWNRITIDGMPAWTCPECSSIYERVTVP